jgi:hypothetical protein
MNSFEIRYDRTATQAMTRRRYLDYCAEHDILVDIEAVEVEANELRNKMTDNTVLSIT